MAKQACITVLSFPPKQFHQPFTEQGEKGKKCCIVPELKAKLEALFTWHYNTLSGRLLDFWPAFKWQITVHTGIALNPFRFSSGDPKFWLQPQRGSRPVVTSANAQVLGGTWAPHWWSPPAACVVFLSVTLTFCMLRASLCLSFPIWGIRVAGFCQTQQWGDNKHCTHRPGVAQFPPSFFSHIQGDWI